MTDLAVETVVAGRVVARVRSRTWPTRWWTVAWDEDDDVAGGWSCGCLGFGYRRSCRHVAEVRAVVRLTTTGAGEERRDLSDLTDTIDEGGSR
jgi:hypothetical protein